MRSGQLTVGLIAQLVEHCTGITGVTDRFECRSGLNVFFSGFEFTTAYVVCITAMTNHIFISSSGVQIYEPSSRDYQGKRVNPPYRSSS